MPGVELTLKAAVGATIAPLTWSVGRVAGHVPATGETAVEALDRCRLLADQACIRTAAGGPPAPMVPTT